MKSGINQRSQYGFLIETGYRYSAGNWGWGRQILLSFLYFATVINYLKVNSSLKKKSILDVTFSSFAILIYVLHVICGIWYICIMACYFYFDGSIARTMDANSFLGLIPWEKRYS